MSVGARGAVSAAGIVVLLLAIVAIIGILPGFSIICNPVPVGSPTGGCTIVTQQVVASFSTSVSNQTVTLTDASTVVQFGHTTTGNISHIALAWGDGASAVLKQGAVVLHTYTLKGNYTVTERVWATFIESGTNQNYSSFSRVVTVGFGSGAYTLLPSFTLSQANQSVTVLDKTTASGVSGLTLSVAWGDGATSALSFRGSASHTYSPPPSASNSTVTVFGNFTITEKASGLSPNGALVSQSTSAFVLVPFPGTKTCQQTGTCTPPPPPPPPPTTTPPASAGFNLFTAFLLSLGIVLGAFPWFPASIAIRIGSGTVVVALISVLGWTFGGLGIL